MFFSLYYFENNIESFKTLKGIDLHIFSPKEQTQIFFQKSTLLRFLIILQSISQMVFAESSTEFENWQLVLHATLITIILLEFIVYQIKIKRLLELDNSQGKTNQLQFKLIILSFWLSIILVINIITIIQIIDDTTNFNSKTNSLLCMFLTRIFSTVSVFQINKSIVQSILENIYHRCAIYSFLCFSYATMIIIVFIKQNEENLMDIPGICIFLLVIQILMIANIQKLDQDEVCLMKRLSSELKNRKKSLHDVQKQVVPPKQFQASKDEFIKTEKLNKKSQIYKSILGLIPVGVLFLNYDNSLAYHNQTVNRIFKISESDKIIQTFRRLIIKTLAGKKRFSQKFEPPSQNKSPQHKNSLNLDNMDEQNIQSFKIFNNVNLSEKSPTSGQLKLGFPVTSQFNEEIPDQNLEDIIEQDEQEKDQNNEGQNLRELLQAAYKQKRTKSSTIQIHSFSQNFDEENQKDFITLKSNLEIENRKMRQSESNMNSKQGKHIKSFICSDNENNLRIKVTFFDMELTLDQQGEQQSPRVSPHSSYLCIIIQDFLLIKENQYLKNDLKNKARVFAQISHELKTPLNCSINLLKILKKNVDDQTQQQFLQPILNSNNLLHCHFNNLIDFLHFEVHQFKISPRSDCLFQIIKDCIKMMLIKVESSGKDILVENPDKLLKDTQIFNDGQRLQQVLINILDNSFKFSDVGTQIKIKIEPDTYNNQHGQEVKCFRIAIFDQGKQDQKTRMEKLNDVISALNSINNQDKLENASFRGQTLGLFLCKKICENLTQRRPAILFHFFSINSTGSVVQFYLDAQTDNQIRLSVSQPGHTNFNNNESLKIDEPSIFNNGNNNIESEGKFNRTNSIVNFKDESMIIQENLNEQSSDSQIEDPQENIICASDRRLISPNSSPRERDQKFRILVVDDDLFNQMTLQEMLGFIDSRIVVSLASNGQQAIDQVQERYYMNRKSLQEDIYFSLILMDIDMPIKNGYQASREIREFYKHIQDQKLDSSRTLNSQKYIIACSAFINSNEIFKSNEHGMDGYWEQPLDIKVMEQFVKTQIIEATSIDF